MNLNIFSKHPKGLGLIFFTEMAERFSYYGMRSLFFLFLVSVFFSYDDASGIYGSYTGLVYLTPLLGGWIANRYWGMRRSVIVGAVTMSVGQLLMFLSACVAKQSIFTDGGIIDPSVDNSFAIFLMFTGLAVLIIGNGFFKPNLSSMVGDLYDDEEMTSDSRRDSAYTLYYCGVNIGAFLAPIVCGFVSSNGNWSNPNAFKWAFLCSSIAMVAGLIVFLVFKDKMLVSPNGKQLGLAPKRAQNISSEQTLIQNKTPLWVTVSCLIVGIGLFFAFSINSNNYNDYIAAAVYAISIVLPIYIISDRNLTKSEKLHIGVIYIVAVFVVFFWAAYEQAGSSLTIFAERHCDRFIGSWEVPTAWFQSLNPVLIILLAPVMAFLWEKLAEKKIEPSSPTKQGIGLLLLAIGYAVIAYGTYGITEQKSSMWWLVILYLIHTVAELALSPIGQSMVYKLSPSRMVSLLMGVWFLSYSASNVLAGSFAKLLPQAGEINKSFMGFEVTTLSDFFLIFAVLAGGAALILLCLCPLLNKMMHSKAK